MDDIDISMGDFKVIFTSSERELPPHLDGWMLYEVYKNDEYAGLVADTGTHSEYEPYERLWRPLEDSVGKTLPTPGLNQQEPAASFIRGLP
jgi:hypothetical protein